MLPSAAPRFVALFLGAAALAPGLVPGAGLSAQDVEQLGRIYGTTPPEGYFREKAANPRAYQLSRAWMARNPRLRVVETAGDGPPRVELRARPSGGDGSTSGTGVAAVLGRREGPVEGTFRFPLLLGYYSDMAVPPPFTQAKVQAEFFDGPNSRHGTITDFYQEMSGGRVQLQGVTFDWVQSSRTRAEVTGGQQGLAYPAQVAGFIKDLLQAADAGGTDWGQFDNDGPDGVPNSGDDDGWVDLLTVFHPTGGAECGGGDRIWSHKWSLSSWGTGYYTTSTPRAGGGGFIRVDDYTIQPVYNCSETAINEIGVFAHELGHGFGLPDLYCTASGCSHYGAGSWDLMASGSWGCVPSPPDPARPCHMSAWSKHVLGWVDVVEPASGQDLGTALLEPVISGGTVWKVNAQSGSGEYFLLENRQREGFDQSLVREGLLVWHIDPAWIDTYWPSNSVNNNRNHLGVWLRQADGTSYMTNRADAGDPFPGSSGNPAFHAGSVPRATTHGGQASGLTLLDITPVADQVSFRALTRFQTVTLRTRGESTGGLFKVDGAGLPGSAPTFESAPFQSHVIEAAAGELLGPGHRRAFEEWADDATAPRVRTVETGLSDAEYVALYGQEQVQLDVSLSGGKFGVLPGTLVTTPGSSDLWFTPGTLVTLQAVPTPGFSFREWTGGLAGEPNPAVVTLDAPMTAGAAFDFTYALPDEVELVLEAAVEPQVQLAAPLGTAPYQWSMVSGSLPLGTTLLPDGRLAGAPMVLGTFPVQVRVVDDLGLEAVGALRLEVDPPALSMASLSGPFTGSGAEPNLQQRLFLDQNGNGNGYYDLGDLRAFLRSNPTALAPSRASSGVVTVPLAVQPPEVRRPGGQP